MRNKLKYILSAVMVIATTVLMVLAPDMAFLGTEANSQDYTYKCEATPIFAPVEPSQVADVFVSGEFISRYDYFEIDTKQIRRLSIEAMERFLSQSEEMKETVKKNIVGEDIKYQQVNSVIAVVGDRMVVMDYATVRYSSGVAVTFEKSTLTVLGFTMFSSDGEFNELKAVGECSEDYISSYIKNPNVKYDSYSWSDEYSRMLYDFVLAPSAPKEAEWYVEN